MSVPTSLSRELEHRARCISAHYVLYDITEVMESLACSLHDICWAMDRRPKNDVRSAVKLKSRYNTEELQHFTEAEARTPMQGDAGARSFEFLLEVA